MIICVGPNTLLHHILKGVLHGFTVVEHFQDQEQSIYVLKLCGIGQMVLNTEGCIWCLILSFGCQSF